MYRILFHKTIHNSLLSRPHISPNALSMLHKRKDYPAHFRVVIIFTLWGWGLRWPCNAKKKSTRGLISTAYYPICDISKTLLDSAFMLLICSITCQSARPAPPPAAAPSQAGRAMPQPLSPSRGQFYQNRWKLCRILCRFFLYTFVFPKKMRYVLILSGVFLRVQGSVFHLNPDH
jgi:hypothetical protein